MAALILSKRATPSRVCRTLSPVRPGLWTLHLASCWRILRCHLIRRELVRITGLLSETSPTSLDLRVSRDHLPQLRGIPAIQTLILSAMRSQCRLLVYLRRRESATVGAVSESRAGVGSNVSFPAILNLDLEHLWRPIFHRYVPTIDCTVSYISSPMLHLAANGIPDGASTGSTLRVSC
jgi:hypothetical protein